MADVLVTIAKIARINEHGGERSVTIEFDEVEGRQPLTLFKGDTLAVSLPLWKVLELAPEVAKR